MSDPVESGWLDEKCEMIMRWENTSVVVGIVCRKVDSLTQKVNLLLNQAIHTLSIFLYSAKLVSHSTISSNPSGTATKTYRSAAWTTYL